MLQLFANNLSFALIPECYALTMPVRLAACDPCRYSRLACDHSKPVCSRCRDRNQAANCAYRERPFKKRRNQRISPILREVAT